jgi:hypothetical protein
MASSNKVGFAAPSRTAKSLIFVTVLLTTLLPCAELVLGGRGKKFALAASDAFYYLTVARHVVVDGLVSFDGERPTNGFHPFWQAICVVLLALTRLVRADDAFSLTLALVAGVLLLGAAVTAAGYALIDREGDLSPAFILVPLGFGTFVYASLLLIGWHRIGRPSSCLWGAVNGMESALAIAAYSAILHIYVRRPRDSSYGYLLGAALATLAFARLDHAVFSLMIGLGLVVFDSPPNRAKNLVAFGVFCLSLAVYAVANKIIFGLPLPISGALKSTFPQVTPTNRTLFRYLLLSPRKLPLTHAQRGLQLALPSMVALVHLGVMLVRRKKASELSRVDLLLALTTPGVIALSLYDFLFVPKLDQGFWYFPVSFLYVSLASVRAMEPLFANRKRRQTLIPASVFAVSTLVGYAHVRPQSQYPKRAEFYYEEAPKIRAFYGATPPKILEYDDGIITFATGFKAMSGMGLALDADAIPAAGGIGRGRTGRNSLLDLALERGFVRFCTFSYAGKRLHGTSSDKDIREAYEHLIDDQARTYDLRVDYSSDDSDFSMISATPRARRSTPTSSAKP